MVLPCWILFLGCNLGETRSIQLVAQQRWMPLNPTHRSPKPPVCDFFKPIKSNYSTYCKVICCAATCSLLWRFKFNRFSCIKPHFWWNVWTAFFKFLLSNYITIVVQIAYPNYSQEPMQHANGPDFTSLCVVTPFTFKLILLQLFTLETFTCSDPNIWWSSHRDGNVCATSHNCSSQMYLQNHRYQASLAVFFFLAKMLLGVMKHVAAETAASLKMESCRRQAARLRLLSKVTNFTVHRRLCGKLLARCAEWNEITVAVIIDVIYYFAALCCLQLIYIQTSRKIQWYFPQAVTVQTRVWNVIYQA